jgi:predicted enzyme related to lactoylglutathione lyase
MDMKLELVLVPVTDVDRAKAFYADKVGFTLDVDHAVGDEFRVVQFTPPGRRARSRSASASSTRSRAR